MRNVDCPSGRVGVFGVCEKIPGVSGTRLGVDGTGEAGGNDWGMDNWCRVAERRGREDGPAIGVSGFSAAEGSGTGVGYNFSWCEVIGIGGGT